MKAKTGRAKMPWNGVTAYTKLSDGRVVLRGSREAAIDRYGEELVRDNEVKQVQAAVVAAINALGETLIGLGFVPITSSPVPDEEVVKILTRLPT